MKPKDLQKMCSHCDGRIPIEATECPYCAAEQGAESKVSSHQSLNDSLSGLYTPPYSARGSAYSEEKNFSKASAEMKTGSYSMGATLPSQEESDEKAQGTFWPILLLSVGGNLLLLGLLQLFFSNNGKLRLEWDSGYWFLYCLISLPLVFFGFKKANLLK